MMFGPSSSSILRHYALNKVKFVVGPVQRTTPLAKAILGRRTNFPEYLSRDIFPEYKRATYSQIQLDNVHLVPYSPPKINSVRLAVPAKTVVAILANLHPRVTLAEPVVPGQDLTVMPGNTTVPVWLTYSVQGPGEAWSEVRAGLEDKDGAKLSREELRGRAARATVEVILTLAYRGKSVKPQDRETTPMSLKFHLRELKLTE